MPASLVFTIVCDVAARADGIGARPADPRVEIRRAEQRQHTRTGWLDSAHSFSFGQAYDPDNTHFGLLLASNEDVIAPHSGYDRHLHRDLEILTWVLAGELTHEDSGGHRGQLRPGLIQRMSAGSGIEHSERNEAAEPVHFVQMWLMPDEQGRPPDYAQADVSEQLAGGELIPVASGLPRHRGSTAIPIRQSHAGLSIARLPAGGSTMLPPAPYLHVFVSTGTVAVEGIGVLRGGDAIRLRDAEGQRAVAEQGAELLVWEMATDLAS
jgi:redox-sensitive bicupin YhaK (pirin superfamily)